MGKALKIIVGTGAIIAAVSIGTAVGGSGGDGPPGKETITEKTAPAKPKKAAKPAGPGTSFRSGTFLVGTDIKAGTYKTPGPADDDWVGSCYWARNSDDSGELKAIIANDNITGPGRVTVKAGEIFETSGDCKWKRVTP